MTKAKQCAPWLDRPIDKVRERKFYCYVLMDPRFPGPFAFGGRVYPFMPFYIGKGTGYRLHAHFTEAKRYKREGHLPNDVEFAKITRILEIMDSGVDEKTFKKLCAVKLVENLNEFESFENETKLITEIGRLARRMGPLVNENDGTQFNGGYQKVVIPGFSGMRSIIPEGDLISDPNNPVVVPRVILNADVMPNGQVVKRKGKRLLIELPGSRGLWACRHGLFCVATGPKLYRIIGDRAIEICTINSAETDDVFGVDLGDMIAFSTKSDLIYYFPATGTISRDLAPTPAAVAATSPAPAVGHLAPGRYGVCLTKRTNGLESAPCAPFFVDVTTSDPNVFDGSIMVHSAEECVVWITEPNGEVFYRSDETSIITNMPTVEPLQTFGCFPFFPIVETAVAFGRLWGAVGNELWYSEPYRYDLIRPGNFFKFNEEITMVAPCASGVFVGLETKTVFLSGTSIKDMVEKFSGPPPIHGGLAYCHNMPELGNNVPVWVTGEGIVAGRLDGTSLNLTINKIVLTPGLKCASFFRMYKGAPQIGAAFTRPEGAQVGFGDSATCEVIRNGKVL